MRVKESDIPIEMLYNKELNGMKRYEKLYCANRLRAVEIQKE